MSIRFSHIIALASLAVATHISPSVAQTAEQEAARARDMKYLADRRNIRTIMAPAPELYPIEESYLDWPLAPADRAYGAIDGRTLKRYVEAQAQISRVYRDNGHPQFWGRIIGTEGDAASAAWLEGEFRRLGLQNVRSQPFAAPEMTLPDRWQVDVRSGDTNLTLSSALAVGGIKATPAEGISAPVIYVGLGEAADFRGRDVRGKTVLIYSVPLPSAFVTSTTLNMATQRAEAAGAAAVLAVYGVPGNITAFTYCETVNIPCFVIGDDDGAALREAIEAQPEDRPPVATLKLSTRELRGATTAQIWGELPGATDEKIIVIAHRDGFFEAALDNASGVATMLGLAEYYARIPQARRRRTLVFVGTPGHHAPGYPGTAWMAENRDTVFANTALLINAEHTGFTEATNQIGTLRKSNALGAYNWYVGGSPALQQIAVQAWRDFGVPTQALADTRAPGEAAMIWQMAPMIQIISGPWSYHSSVDSPENVPATALAASTRAYAKIIDGANRLSIAELQPASTEPR